MDNKTENKNSGTIDACSHGIVVRIMAVVVPLCVAAIFISAFIVSVANDMYAFVKADVDITFTVEENPAQDIFDTLHDKGIVKNPYIFELYAKSKDKYDKLLDFSGEITLNPSMSYRTIVKEILK